MNLFARLRRPRGQMSCHQVAVVLQSYLDQELDEATVHKVTAHLDACRRCGLEAETYEALKASLHRVPAGPGEAPIARLRAFGEQLARGELDPGGSALP